METTKDYDLFKILPQNRAILESRVKKLAKSISETDMTRSFPIIVDEFYNIIDGQNRFMACKLLERPIHYNMVKLNGDVDRTMININTNQKAWSLFDYISHYAHKGYVEYIKLTEAKAKYSLDWTVAYTLFSANSEYGSGKAIKSGRFKFTNKDVSNIMNIHLDFKCLFDYANTRNFLAAFKTLLNNGYDHNTMFKVFVKNRYSMQACATRLQYLQMFESMINKGKRKTKIKLT